MVFKFSLQLALVASCMLFEASPVSAMGRFTEMRSKQEARHAAELNKRNAAHLKSQGSSNTSDFRFYNDATEPYYVKGLPDLDFDLGELYSGLVPIEKDDPSRALFFMFQPTVGEPVDELTIWLNGGPGCSSLEGFFQENGRYVWQPGTYAPTINEYSWVNLTNVLWVEQPVGTGFSIGTPTATSEEEIAQDFVKFLKNFEDLFGIKNFKIYVTGESYAGRYVPYISAAILDQKDPECFNLSGALVYDPCIGDFTYTQEEVFAVPYLEENANMFNLNESFVQEMQALHQSCGYADYIEKYFTFPPPGNQPAVYFNYTSQANCDVFDIILDAAGVVNPCFNVYETNQQCPLEGDILGFPTALVYESPNTVFNTHVYFDRADVKTAIHAPQNVTWAECANEPVFVGGDSGPQGEGDISADPIQHVLPQVIEATNRVLVGNGDYDMIIITNGTLMAIQNMTWAGQQGFQQRPSTPIDIELEDLQYEALYAANGEPGGDGPGQGVTGIQHFERGLMWVETFQSGHMQPQFQPRTSYRHLQWLLGRVDTL